MTKKNIDHYKWTTFCIWKAIYINYNKLFSDAMKTDNGQKSNKFKINANEFLKDYCMELIDLHGKILSVRHQFFVHGGTEVYEKYQLIAEVQINQYGTKTQLNVDGLKEPPIEETVIPTLRTLVTFLFSKIEFSLDKCNQKLADVLHAAVEKLLDTPSPKDYDGQILNILNDNS